jgi:hypothetical protein
MSFLLRTSRLAPHSIAQIRQFTTSRILCVKIDSHILSQIAAAERALIDSNDRVKNGPTARAQSYTGQELTPKIIADITAGERLITKAGHAVKGGPTSVAQSFYTKSKPEYLSSRGNSNNNASANATLDSDAIRNINTAEKTITGQDGPVQNGPTAAAQRHVGEPITSDVISDINRGEQNLPGVEDKISGGPTTTAQKIDASQTQSQSATSASSSSNSASGSTNSATTPSGNLDSSTISKITDAEKNLTGEDGPVQDGPTAQAQRHAGEQISSEALHDITEGEKSVTGGERVKGGPTSVAQSELGRSRND